MDYSILVNSTDGFGDCWLPFFKLFSNFWPNCKQDIYLNTETKEFKFPGLNIISSKVCSPNLDCNITWSESLLRCLDIIEDEIILYLQEDYFLNEYVNYQQIEEFVQLMRNKNIGCIQLTHFATPGPFTESDYPLLKKIGKKAEYKISTQASIWEKEILKKYIKKHETPWHFEIYGTLRAQRKNEEFYCINTDMFTEKKIISYIPTGIVKGKWNRNAVEKLFAEYNIMVDFSKRGFTDDSTFTLRTKKMSFKKIINRLKSLY